MDLSPTQLHYYKRELISLELQRELDKLKQNPDVFALLRDDSVDTEYPFLRYITRQFVTKFPLLKHGGSDEFWNKCQTFLRELSKVKLDTYTPKKSSATQRRILIYKIQKLMNVGLSASIKTKQGDEQAIKVNPSQLRKEEEEMTKEMEKEMTFLENEDHYLEWIGFNGLNINVVTVRDVSEKRTLREASHAEFVICTYFQDQPEPVFVGRRHGDFRRLHQELRAKYPAEDLPNVPSKASDPSFENGENKQERKVFHRRSQELRHAHLYREKDRLLLRSFLRRVASVPKLAKSDIFRRFLTENPIELTQEQIDDAEKRKELDTARYEEEARFREQVDQKLSELNELLSMLKKQIMRPGGLLEVFDIIKTTERIEDLPDPIRKGFEWGRINLAFVLHTQFITSDRASENIASLKRAHALMPYRAVAQILKLSNPFAMVKGVLDLFLAQPFGRRSLFQRIVMASMSDEAKEVQQDIAELETQIQDPELCRKIRNAVETPLAEDFSFQSRSSIGQTLEVLRSEDIEPALTPQQIVKLASATKEPEHRELVKQLHRLWTLYAAKREHEVLMALAFQGVTGELLREIFAMFYEPLAQVYKAANIGDSINHLSAFIDDLIALLDSIDVQDVSNTTQQFIQLVQRHEQQFYKFVHDVHASDSSRLFDELLQYVDNMFAVVANGIPGRVDMDQVASAAGVTDHEALKKEIDAICDYHWRRKAQHMQRTRQKLMMDQQEEQIEAEEAFDFLPNKSEVVGVFQDLAEFDEEDDDLFDDDDSYYSSSDGSSNKTPVAHEMTLEPPQLELLPKIVPAFVTSVVELLRASNQ